MTCRTAASRLHAEQLEDRSLPAPLTTITNFDPGTITNPPTIPPPGDKKIIDPRPIPGLDQKIAVAFRTETELGEFGPEYGHVSIFDSSRRWVTGFQVYETPFDFLSFESVYVAMADVTGDGVEDVVTGASPLIGWLPFPIKVYDGATLRNANGPTLIRSFEAFGGDAGNFVACGDFDGDWKAEIVVSRCEGGTGRVKVFSGADIVNPAVTFLFPAVEFDGIVDPNATSGAAIAVGRVNDDRVPDLVVGALDGPRVSVFDGTTLRAGQTPTNLFNDFYAFDPAVYAGGIDVAVGDLSGDGWGEVIATTRVDRRDIAAFDGQTLVQSGPANLAPWFSGVGFGARNPFGNGSGLRVTVKHLDWDGRADLVLSHPYRARVTTILGKDITPGTNINQSTLTYTPFEPLDPPNEWVGVWVG